ncbi:MAG: putative family transposase orfA [Oscillospiraceae bacterium]|jgi:transposase|nr:putative family transposase orfA [Oscillospiraceae bacterium]
MGNYNDEFKKKIVKLHLENGCSLKSLSDEFNISKSGISNWVKKYREECQTNTETKAEYDLMAENLRLRKQLEEVEKENLFLKKAAAFFAKEID